MNTIDSEYPTDPQQRAQCERCTQCHVLNNTVMDETQENRNDSKPRNENKGDAKQK